MGNSLGINPFEAARLLLFMRRQLKTVFDKEGWFDFPGAVRYVGRVLVTLARFANDGDHKRFFSSQGESFIALANIIEEGEFKMAKIKLGITPGEIMGMIPGLASEAWSYYSDNKQIDADEGVLLVASLMQKLGTAADHEEIKAFFIKQAEATAAMAPILAKLGEESEGDEAESG